MFKPFDPLTFTLKSAAAWARYWQVQQEIWLRYIGAVAEQIPHESAAELAAEADAHRAANAVRPRAKPAPRPRADDAGKPGAALAEA